MLLAGGAIGVWLYGDRLPAVAGRVARRAGSEAADLAIRARFDSSEAAERLAKREAERQAEARAADSALGWAQVAAVPSRGAANALAARLRPTGDTALMLAPREVAALLAPIRRMLPASASTVSVAMTDALLLLRLDLARQDYAGEATLRDLLGITLVGRDTLDLAGQLELVRPGLAAYRVQRVTIKGIEVPPRFLPSVISSLRDGLAGRRRSGTADSSRLAPDALPLPLPKTIRDIRLDEGQLVLSRDPGQRRP